MLTCEHLRVATKGKSQNPRNRSNLYELGRTSGKIRFDFGKPEGHPGIYDELSTPPD